MEKTDKTRAREPSMPDLMKAMQRAGLQGMPVFGTQLMESMADFGAEMLSFVAARVRQDVETQHELLRAKDLAEVHHIQAKFIQKAIDDYRAETARLMKMGKALVPDEETSG